MGVAMGEERVSQVRKENGKVGRGRSEVKKYDVGAIKAHLERVIESGRVQTDNPRRAKLNALKELRPVLERLRNEDASLRAVQKYLAEAGLEVSIDTLKLVLGRHDNHGVATTAPRRSDG